MKASYKNIKREIVSIVSSVTKIPQEEIDTKTPFTKAGIDSFAVLEIIFALENKYDITLPEKQLSIITTIEELVKLVEKVLEKNG